MTLDVQAINHVGLVVTDLAASEQFDSTVLGFPRHHVRPNWFVLNTTSTLHLVPLGDPGVVEPPHHGYRHVAFQVSNLRAVLVYLLSHGLRVFQADFTAGDREVTSVDDPLDYGVGTLFVRDPDGNLIEFLQIGLGLFTEAMQPRAGH